MEYLIIGIGINVNNSLDQFSPPLRKTITTTWEITKTNISLEELLQVILKHLEDGLYKMKIGEEEEILLEWKKWNNILGEKITIISNNIEYEGIAKDLNLHGQMLLELADGRKITFSSGVVSLL